MFFEFLHAKPWRTIQKLHQKVSFGSPFFLCSDFVLKNRRFWYPDSVFWWKNNVLQVSGRNTFENAYKITSKSKFSTQNVQIPYHLHPALSNSLHSIQVGEALAAKLEDERSLSGYSAEQCWPLGLSGNLWRGGRHRCRPKITSKKNSKTLLKGRKNKWIS